MINARSQEREKAVERRLAAILAIDVVGYGRLMEADESATLAALKRHRQDLINPKAAQYRGRTIKLMGDGALMEFPSVVDAVAFAVEVQSAMARRNAGLPEPEQIAYRIGINIGDVVVEDDDIFGPGVIVASRLEGLAEPGGIAVARNVYNQVKGKLNLSFEHEGERPVKNIDEPVSVYRVPLDEKAMALVTPVVASPAGIGRARRRTAMVTGVVLLAFLVLVGSTARWLLPRSDAPRPPAISPDVLEMPAGPGIAVLPFDNLSQDSEQDLLSRAITEEIITALTRFSELRVAARSSTARFADELADVRMIARELGVAFVLKGSVQRAGDRIRVSAQLLDGRDGKHVWAETYEHELTPADIFDVQQEIAKGVVGEIGSISGGAISRATIEETRGMPPRSLSAYECTLRVNDMMLKGFSPAGRRSARTCLESTTESEPEYATAWAMLAWVYAIEHAIGRDTQANENTGEKAVATARRAVELAPENPMARFAMARAAYLMRDLNLFYTEAAQAVKLNPHDPFVLGSLGNWLAYSGRWAEGVAMVKKAIALNHRDYPRWWHMALGKNHYRSGEYREALREFKAVNLPNFWWNQVELAYTYGQLGELEEAKKATAKLQELYPGFDLEAAALEHRKFSFEQSFIDLAVEGLRKAGVPEKAP